MEAGEAAQGVPFVPHNEIPDALAAYRHFLFGHGADRTFSYERYVAGDTSGATTLANAMLDAQDGAIQLYNAQYFGKSVQFKFSSGPISVGDPNKYYYPRFPYPATENWQKAIGAHVVWLSGDVAVDASVGRANLHLTLHAEDRYNFNVGNHDIATGIPDAANGIFEITGLASQYMNYAELRRTVSWKINAPSSQPTVNDTVSRERQPQDNRRIRNLL